MPDASFSAEPGAGTSRASRFGEAAERGAGGKMRDVTVRLDGGGAGDECRVYMGEEGEERAETE